MRNRLYRADCKTVIEDLIKQGVRVDLIYLDPPFNSNRTYSMLFQNNGVTAQQKAYHDMWDFTDSTRQLVLDFRSELDTWDLSDSFKDFIRAWLNILESGTSQDRKLLNYLMYMTQRLVVLRRVLKPTGSIYFHCDPTASHYIKVIMDGIFGRDNFRNEIVWKRTYAHNRAKRWGPIHDIILFYSKKGGFTWNRVLQDHDPDYLDTYYTKEDDKGRFQDISLTGPGQRDGSSGQPWRNIEPGGRHWELPPDRSLPDWFVFPDGYSDRNCQERLDILDGQNLIYWPPTGTMPRFKRYASVAEGNPVQDIIVDVRPAGRKERLGYETQKPVKLLERIIASSSNPGDVILDPFCGCGTSIEAAHRLGRQWIGIDISGPAVDEIEARLAKHGQYPKTHFDVLEGNPETIDEYRRLNAYEKQDWLIRRLNGLPNPRKSGDGGVDGDLDIHLGVDKDGRDKWGRVIFSVKTGKQRKPEHVRELIGTMRSERAQIGVLILDLEPTEKMEEAARKAKTLRYQQRTDMPPKEYDRVQIVTAYEIIEGAKIDCPPTMQVVKRFREAQMEMQV